MLHVPAVANKSLYMVDHFYLGRQVPMTSRNPREKPGKNNRLLFLLIFWWKQGIKRGEIKIFCKFSNCGILETVLPGSRERRKVSLYKQQSTRGTPNSLSTCSGSQNQGLEVLQKLNNWSGPTPLTSDPSTMLLSFKHSQNLSNIPECPILFRTYLNLKDRIPLGNNPFGEEMPSTSYSFSLLLHVSLR